MGIDPKELMSYKKYVQSFIRFPIHGRRNIAGKFKERGSRKVIDGDNFPCIEFGKRNALECYKAAIAYFNHTRSEKEKERKAVSAKWNDSSIPPSSKDEGILEAII